LVEEPIEVSRNEDSDNNTLSTSPTTATQPAPASKYFLFEQLLSFLDTDEQVNSVLAGYFAKVFAVLLSGKAQDVYRYVYSHPRVLERMVRHLDQKSVSELL